MLREAELPIAAEIPRLEPERIAAGFVVLDGAGAYLGNSHVGKSEWAIFGRYCDIVLFGLTIRRFAKENVAVIQRILGNRHNRQ